MLYNCEKAILQPPKDFISRNINGRYKTSVRVDKCLAKEITSLWEQGVKTLGCCCGHGKKLGFIQVTNDSCKKMLEMGYVNYIYDDRFGGIERKDAFIPKSYGHYYNGYIDGFQG